MSIDDIWYFFVGQWRVVRASITQSRRRSRNSILYNGFEDVSTHVWKRLFLRSLSDMNLRWYRTYGKLFPLWICTEITMTFFVRDQSILCPRIEMIRWWQFTNITSVIYVSLVKRTKQSAIMILSVFDDSIFSSCRCAYLDQFPDIISLQKLILLKNLERIFLISCWQTSISYPYLGVSLREVRRLTYHCVIIWIFFFDDALGTKLLRNFITAKRK